MSGCTQLNREFVSFKSSYSIKFNTSLIRKQKFWMRLTWIHQSFEELGDSKVTNIYSGISDSIVIRKQIILFSGSYCQIRVGANCKILHAYFLYSTESFLRKFRSSVFISFIFLFFTFTIQMYIISYCDVNQTSGKVDIVRVETVVIMRFGEY